MKVLFSITLSFLTLFSSLNVVVSQHFCQEQLRTISFFGEAEACHDVSDKETVQCPVHGEMERPIQEGKRDNCCENKSFQLDGQEIDVTVPQITLDIVLPVVLAVVGDVFPVNAITSDSDYFVVNNHSPPNLPEILSLIQVYLL